MVVAFVEDEDEVSSAHRANGMGDAEFRWCRGKDGVDVIFGSL